MEQLIIHQKINEIRGLKVILDKDLALLYGVETKRLNETDMPPMLLQNKELPC